MVVMASFWGVRSQPLVMSSWGAIWALGVLYVHQ
jgi:hypothetical protein